MTASNQNHKARSILIWLLFFWLMSLTCGATAQRVSQGGRGLTQLLPIEQVREGIRLASQKESYDLALKYLNGLADAAVHLEQLPGKGGLKELTPLLVIVRRLPAGLKVDRFSMEGEHLVISGHGPEDLAVRFFLVLKTEKEIAGAEYITSPSTQGKPDFVIRCLL